jgi:hypothetical protein
MKNQSVIEEVRAMEILDSRGNPTVRVHEGYRADSRCLPRCRQELQQASMKLLKCGTEIRVDIMGWEC